MKEAELNSPAPIIETLSKDSNFIAKFKADLSDIDTQLETCEPLESKPVKANSYKDCIIDVTKLISPPEPILIQSSTGITLANLRNASATAAAMKVGKTKQNIAFTVAILHPDGYLDFHCPKENARVLIADTEQDASDTLEIVNGVNKLLGKPKDTVLDNLLVLNLREVLKPERVKFIEQAIIDFKPDFAIIDGIVDLCNDFNSIADSNEAIETLTRWASKYNCHIHTNIHVNKGANNQETRGHLGQMLRQKGEFLIILSIKHDGNIYYREAKQVESRHRPIENYYFYINNDGLPESYEPAEALPKADILKALIEVCFEGEIDLRYGELTLKIMQHGKVKIDAAKGKIARALKSGFVFKNKAGLYHLLQTENENEILIFE